MKVSKKVKKQSIAILLLGVSQLIYSQENEQNVSQRIDTLEAEIAALKSTSNSTWPYANTLIHLAGYADVNYVNVDDADDTFAVGNFSPIFHFQYRDLVMLESELEVELEEDGETEVALEYLSVDLFLNDYVTLVMGKFLSPVGQFRQNLHPSWINKLASAPPGFGHDGAAPVSDVGFQFRGGANLGKWKSNYALYMSNGPELLAEFEDGEYELDGVEAEGFNNDADGKRTIGGRFAVFPRTRLELGLSFATGEATVTDIENGDSSLLAGEGLRDYDVMGADFNYQDGFFTWRGEYVETKVGETVLGTAASEGATWETWYTQASFNEAGDKWEYVVRYTDFDSPHDSRDQQQWGIGINYLYTNNAIVKFTYEKNDGESGEESDQDRIVLQLAYGF